MKAAHISAICGAAAGLALLVASAAPVSAAPASFSQAVAWQQRHAVSIRVADLSNREQCRATAKRLKKLPGVAFVEFDRKQNLIRVIPWENEHLNPLAVRQVVETSGFEAVAVSPSA